MSAIGDRTSKVHTKKVERLWPLQPLRFRRLCPRCCHVTDDLPGVGGWLVHMNSCGGFIF